MKDTKKKWIMRLAAMVLGLTAGILLVIAASKDWIGAELGDLSQYYETGDSADPGYISTVVGDSGGTSYGIYMFSSNAGTPYSFALWMSESGSQLYRSWGTQLIEAYTYNTQHQVAPGYGSNFNATWTSIADSNREGFMQAQKDYWFATNYSTLLSNIKTQCPAFDMSRYGIALQNVFWSRGVQHGVNGATNVIIRAFNNLGGFKNQSEAELIQAIYAESSKLDGIAADNVMSGATAQKYGVGGRSMTYYSANSGSVQMSVYRRLHVNEPSDALVMRYSNFAGILPDGYYQLTDNAEQRRALVGSSSVTLNVANTADAKQQWKLVYYDGSDGGCYTISIGENRLTDQNTTPALATPAASNNQLWKIEKVSGAYAIRNLGTGSYLSVDSTRVTLSASQYLWQPVQLGIPQGIGLYYPGCESGVSYRLVAGNSSFPVRGVVISSLPLTNVTVKVATAKAVAFTASSGNISTSCYDLWKLDDYCTFSKLPAGSYTLTITATTGGNTWTLATAAFKVEQNSGGTDDDETYTVTFDAQGGVCQEKSRTYQLGDTYGELPAVTKDGYEFTGWFMADGTQVNSNTPVAAADHTLYAGYGDTYTVTFLKEDGSVLQVDSLAQGELICSPSVNPVKAPSGGYAYSFTGWVDKSGTKFVADKTYMATGDVTYSPTFEKATEYLTGIKLKTGVSALTDQGYTVYKGDTAVTSGRICTGMTAVFGTGSVPIVVTGDVNGDGRLSITDVVLIQLKLIGKLPLDGAYTKACDLTGDGKVSITDVIRSAQVLIGMRTIG